MTGTERVDTSRATGALDGRTVVVIGGSSGIGLETADQARRAGADVVITGRDPERLERAAEQVTATRAMTLDLADLPAVSAFFAELERVDHVLVSGGGPVYAPLPDLDLEQARAVLEEHLLGTLLIGRECLGRVPAGGSLTLITGTHARRAGIGLSVAAISAAAVPALTADLALELAPIRVNAIAAGFVDTPLSARLLGADLEQRRARLRETLPIRRVVTAADVALLAVHLMENTALTGSTFDVDGGQQLLGS